MLFLNALQGLVIYGVVIVGLVLFAKALKTKKYRNRHRENSSEIVSQKEMPNSVATQFDAQGKRLHSYDRIDFLFSEAERNFLSSLGAAIQGRYAIFGKVRISDIAEPAKRYYGKPRMYVANRINQKHVDFVICQRDNLHIVGVVELDDSSHNQPNRIGRDALVDHVMQSAGIPILHVPVSSGYNVQTLQSQLQQTLGLQLALASPERVDFAGNRAA